LATVITPEKEAANKALWLRLRRENPTAHLIPELVEKCRRDAAERPAKLAAIEQKRIAKLEALQVARQLDK
jgi:hypothetical protein